MIAQWLSAISPMRLTCALLLIAPLLVAGTASTAAAGSRSPTLVAQMAAPSKPRTIEVVAQTVQNPIVGTGSIEPAKSSDIGPLVSGLIDHVYVDVGDQVKAGQPLFRTRRINFELRLAQAKAGLKMAQATAEEARIAFHRAAKLFARRNASEATRDAALSKMRVSQAEVDMAKVKLKTAEQELADTIVTAPFDGVITKRFLDEGVYLSNVITGGSAAVVRLTALDKVIAVVEVPARDLANLSVGDKAELRIDGVPGTRRAKISVINSAINPQTRTAEVRLDLDNADGAIRAGVFVQAKIIPQPRKVLLLPREAVVSDAEHSYVYRLHAGQVKKIPIKAEDYDRQFLEVKAGLSVGDRIVIGRALKRLKRGELAGGRANVAG